MPWKNTRTALPARGQAMREIPFPVVTQEEALCQAVVAVFIGKDLLQVQADFSLVGEGEGSKGAGVGFIEVKTGAGKGGLSAGTL